MKIKKKTNLIKKHEKVWEACFLTRKVNSLCDLFYRHTHIKLFKPNRQTSHLKARAQPLGCAQLLATPWTAARQAPPCMGLRPEHWRGEPLPSPGVFPSRDGAPLSHLESSTPEPTPSDPWTAARQAPPCMALSGQGYCSGAPLPAAPEAL